MSDPACAAVTPLFWAWKNAHDLRSKKIAKKALLSKLKDKIDYASLDLSYYDYMCIKLMRDKGLDVDLDTNSITVRLWRAGKDGLNYLYFPSVVNDLWITGLRDDMSLLPLKKPGLERIMHFNLSNSTIVKDHLEVFPGSVESMGIYNSRFKLDDLPPSLTELRIVDSEINLESERVRFPDGLKTLVISNCTLTIPGKSSEDSFSLHIDSLPAQLKYFEMKKINFVAGGLDIDFRGMPASIESIVLAGCGVRNIKIDPTNLPPRLQEINLAFNPLDQDSKELLSNIQRDNPGINVIW